MRVSMINAITWLKAKWFTVFLFLVIVALIVIVLFRPANNGVATATDPSTLIVQPGNPAALAPGNPVAIPTNATVFCLQIDGRGNGHLPMLMGIDGPDIIWNQERTGKNWAMVPSSDETKDVGVLLDGRIYAKAAFLKKWGMTQSCAVKCDQTGWDPTTMTTATIGGEEALVFQLK